MSVLTKFLKQAEKNVERRVYEEDVVAEARRLHSLENDRKRTAATRKRDAERAEASATATRKRLRDAYGAALADRIELAEHYHLVATPRGFVAVSGADTIEDAVRGLRVAGVAVGEWREHRPKVRGHALARDPRSGLGDLALVAVDPDERQVRELAKVDW